MMDSKAIYASKTFWVNLLALAGSLLVGNQWLTTDQMAELSVTVMAVVNIALRLVSKDAVSILGSTTSTDEAPK